MILNRSFFVIFLFHKLNLKVINKFYPPLVTPKIIKQQKVNKIERVLMIKYKAQNKLTLARVDSQLSDVNFNF